MTDDFQQRAKRAHDDYMRSIGRCRRNPVPENEPPATISVIRPFDGLRMVRALDRESGCSGVSPIDEQAWGSVQRAEVAARRALAHMLERRA